MANVIAFFGILIVCVTCYPAWLALIWRTTHIAKRTQTHIATSPQLCFRIGALIALICVPLLAIVFGLGHGVAQLLGWIGVLALLGVSSIGASGLAAWIGQRNNSDEGSRTVLSGALLLEGAALLPALGWIFVLPATLCVTLGAVVLARRHALGDPRQQAVVTQNVVA
jgi:hypothetical protein